MQKAERPAGDFQDTNPSGSDRIVSDQTDHLSQFENAVAPLLSDHEDVTHSRMIDVDDLILCKRHIVGILRHPEKEIPSEPEKYGKVMSMAVRNKWAIAVKTANCFDVLQRDYWIADSGLNLSARVDLLLMISGERIPMKFYWVEPSYLEEVLIKKTVKRKHVISMSAVLHMLDLDIGFVVYDTLEKHKVFQIRRTRRVSEEVVGKCESIIKYIISGEWPPLCKNTAGRECVNHCPYREIPCEEEKH